MIKIPEQLRNHKLRFILTGYNGKIPLEKRYNTENNYSWFNDKVYNHTGNLAVLTGEESKLIIIDFDNIKYYQTVCDKLPLTFTVITANKKYPHMYYYLDDNDKNFRYFGVDKYFKGDSLIKDKFTLKSIDKFKEELSSKDFKSLLNRLKITVKRVCDIMCDGGRATIPGSSIDNNYYRVLTNPKVEIATITLKQLKAIFDVDEERFASKPQTKKTHNKSERLSQSNIEQSINKLIEIGCERKRPRHFTCLFHGCDGGDCLYLNNDGSLFCFHENESWSSVDYYIYKLREEGIIK